MEILGYVFFTIYAFLGKMFDLANWNGKSFYQNFVHHAGGGGGGGGGGRTPIVWAIREVPLLGDRFFIRTEMFGVDF